MSTNELNIISSNQNGSRPNIYTSITNDLHKFDIILLQEIKPRNIQDIQGIKMHMQNELQANCYFNCTIPNSSQHLSNTGSPNSPFARGGVGIIIQPTVANHSQTQVMSTDVFQAPILRNRYICVRLPWTTGCIYIHSVYAPVEVQHQEAFFNHLPGSRHFEEHSLHIVGGDFNCPLNVSLDTTTQSRYYQTRNQKAIHDWLQDLDLIDEWRESNPHTIIRTARTQRVDFLLPSSGWYETYRLQAAYIDKHSLTTGDHDAPTLHLQQQGPQKRSGYWKCPNNLWRKPEVRTYIIKEITILAKNLKPTLNVQAQWSKFKRLTRIFLQRQQRKQGYYLDKRIREVWTNTKDAIQHWMIQRTTLTSLKMTQLIHKLRLLIKSKREKQTQKSFNKAVQQCETSSKFFFRTPRHAKSQQISSVQNEAGRVSTNEEDIYAEHKHQWQKIWGEIPSPTPYTQREIETATTKLTSEIEHTLDPTQVELLSQPISIAEIVWSIQTGATHSCPGLDGLPFEIYKIAPILFATVLKQVFDQAINAKSFSPGQRKSAIMLLHKKGNTANPKNYRPIALMQVDTKILDRLLNKRLMEVLPTLIHQDQKGFMPRRSIHDNILFVKEIQHYATENEMPWIAQFLDFEKAYDRVSWKYLWTIMSAMGFPDSFISAIQLSYRDNTYLLNINGYLVDGVHPKTGLKQGSPLSPGLFTLAVEPMHQLMRANAASLGVNTFGSYHKAVEAFADDTALFAKDKISAIQQRDIVETYCIASNAKLNLSKTKVLQLNKHAIPDNTSELMPIQPNESVRYLGLQIGNQITPQAQLQPAMDKFFNRLSQWKYRARTTNGRVLLVQTMTLSVLWYTLSVIQIPPDTLHTLNKKIRQFVLTRKLGRLGGSSLMQAPWVHAPRNQGGLGLQNILIVQRRDQLKHLQRALTPSLAANSCQICDWLKLSITTIREAFRQQAIPTSGLDFLHFDFTTNAGKKITKRLSPDLQSILLAWSLCPMSSNTVLTTKHKLNTPILYNRTKRWNLDYKSKLTVTQQRVIRKLQTWGHLHTLGSFLTHEGKWPTRDQWIATIQNCYLQIAVQHPPDIRILNNIYKMAHAVAERQIPPLIQGEFFSEWALTFDEWLRWPWVVDIPHQGPYLFHQCTSKQLYKCLINLPTDHHPFHRHNLIYSSGWYNETHPKLQRWISPTSYNVIQRIQYRLLPLGFTRKHTRIPAQFLCPLCGIETETYHHLFWSCTPSRELWTTQFEKWRRYITIPITWEMILCPNKVQFNGPLPHHLLNLMLWIEIATTTHCIWMERNALTFEAKPLTPLVFRSKTIDSQIQLHLRLLEQTSPSPFTPVVCKNLYTSWFPAQDNTPSTPP